MDKLQMIRPAKLWNYCLVASLALLLWRCASQQPITGGPKDEIPPSLTSSFPEDQSINYTETTFELTFDEYVKADKLSKELIITPITEVKYKTTVRKNTVLIAFDSLLEANTTYIFNFREGITDITENNPAENLRIAFSTGPILDSLSIEGTVTDVMLGKPVKDVSVLLFKETDTLTVKGGKPMYLVKTDDAGFFKIENLKANNYQLVALEEKDGNLSYSKPEERIGFLPQNIRLDSNMSGIQVSLVNYDLLPFKLQKVRTNKQYVDFTFNKLIDTFNITAIDKNKQAQLLPVANKEVIRLFPPVNVERDSFEVHIAASDTLGQAIDSTLSISFPEPRRLEEMAFGAGIFPKPSSELLKADTLNFKINFTKPVNAVQLDSAWLYTATDTLPLVANLSYAKTNTVLRFSLPTPKHPYKILFKRGTFVSIEQDTMKELSTSYEPKLAENYGTVTGAIETWSNSFIVQLLNNGEVEQEIRNERKFTFSWVKPGTKSLRILVDENEDGTWGKGDFDKRILPEKIYFYPSEIAVKANWEIVLDPITF